MFHFINMMHDGEVMTAQAGCCSYRKLAGCDTLTYVWPALSWQERGGERENFITQGLKLLFQERERGCWVGVRMLLASPASHLFISTLATSRQ